MEMSVSIVLLWTCLMFYSGCFLPQIWTNYRIKSTSGMSDGFIWCYFTAYLLTVLYVGLQPFPYPYRIMVPIETSLTTVLLLQRFYYEGIWSSPGFTLSVIASILACGGMLFFAPTYGLFIAQAAGWLSLLIFTINQIPQFIKIIRTKTTYGFSFLFVSMTAIAQVLEIIGGLIEQVPAPTIIMAVRGLVFYICYVYLFNKYRVKR